MSPDKPARSHAAELEALIRQVLETAPNAAAGQKRDPVNDIHHYLDVRSNAIKDDEAIKEVLDLRESTDAAPAKKRLRAIFDGSSEPHVRLHAAIGLIDRFQPAEDDALDLANLCEAAIGAAQRIKSRSAEAYLLGQRGYFLSLQFGKLDLLRRADEMADERVGFALEASDVTASKLRKLRELGQAFSDSFKLALGLAKVSQSPAAMAAVLMTIGNAAGQRAGYLRLAGALEESNAEHELCRKALLAAKNLYAAMNQERDVANVQINLANQIRFLGEEGEAKNLIASVIPVAEKYGDRVLLQKAAWLRESLATGKTPDHSKRERSDLTLSVSLPDGSIKMFPGPVTVMDVAQSIGPGLAKAALAGKVDGKLVDTSYRIESHADVAIVTPKSPEALEILRHSTSHLMAQAVQELFPGAQVTIGPVIENGFYYDFSYKRPFTPEDLLAIEKKMAEIAKKDLPVQRKVMPRDEAVKFFQSIGEKYKAEIIASIPSAEPISLYGQGNWIDLCRGPHVPSTGKLKVFKLMRVAGAYWRGDSKNEMLQRIYGTAWATKEEQDAYLKMLEEAEKRDHRRLGTQLDLFHMEEDAPGMVFWHPKGWTLWQQLEQYMRKVYLDSGYQEVRGPTVLPRSLWETTGHWQNYRDNMFTTESEKRDYALKPMNCPGHILIYKKGVKSYRDLPLRYGEFGSCHRNEPSGALHGIMRTRGFTQDDGHIFCTEEQILPECVAYTSLVQKVYDHFGFKHIIYKVATRPEKRIGSDEAWDKAEKALIDAMNASGCPYELSPGDGAFYGPKIEYSLKDAIGRVWQCGTMQVDFNLPERLGAEYVTAENTRRTPAMLHRATIGSMERFMGILIEHFGGAFPVWLAPEQAVVLCITVDQAEYAEGVAKALRQAGFRVKSDLRNEKISYKIREHSLQKLPYQLVVGDKEKQAGTVAVRTRSGEDLGAMSLAAFIERLNNEASA